MRVISSARIAGVGRHRIVRRQGLHGASGTGGDTWHRPAMCTGPRRWEATPRRRPVQKKPFEGSACGEQVQQGRPVTVGGPGTGTMLVVPETA